MTPFETAAALREKYRSPEPRNQHILYTPADFTGEEMDRRNALAVAVIESGLGICKRCGAAGIDLETWVACETFRAHQRSARP